MDGASHSILQQVLAFHLLNCCIAEIHITPVIYEIIELFKFITAVIFQQVTIIDEM